MSAGGSDSADLVGAYKAILRDVLERRPSGMRQRLAEALGTTRSFVSQISNPAYATPIPAPYIATVFEVCHFSDVERTLFLAAYEAAHRRRGASAGPARAGRTRSVSLTVPDLGSKRLNDEFDALLTDLVFRIGRLTSGSGKRMAEDLASNRGDR